MDLAYQKYECILATSTLPEDETILNVLWGLMETSVSDTLVLGQQYMKLMYKIYV